jgi:hypothetical protein
MSTTVQVHLPHAAPLTPGFKAQAARIGRAVWNGLHAIGAARARKELIRLAIANETTHPELAAQLRRVIDEDWLSKG